MSLMKLLNLFFKPFLILLFLLLVVKNPYSSRNLVANLEPFPDSQHYITTPICFLKKMKWQLCRTGDSSEGSIRPSVPPLYSLSLLPTYLITTDPRNFYFTNLLLAALALILLRKTAIKIFKNSLITNTLSLILVTCYHFYWMPSLPMAENLTLPLFFFGTYLLSNKITNKNIILAGLLAVSFYGSKYAQIPLTLTFGFTYLIKIYSETTGALNKKAKNIFIYLLAGALLAPFLFDFKQYLSFKDGISSPALFNEEMKAFSFAYSSLHLPHYFKPLIGKAERFLWDFTPFLPTWLAILANIGLALSFFQKKTRLIGSFLISSILFQLIFMSFFYAIDARYVYSYLPALILGIGFLLENILNKLKSINMPRKKSTKIFGLLSIFLILFYLTPQLTSLKKQVGLNFKYTQTPWWKVSVDEANIYFDKPDNNYLITLASPFFLDYYSNQNYKPLPISYQQDFRSYFPIIWGEGDYSNLIMLYASKLQDHNVYVTNYGVSANSAFEDAFAEIEKNFTLTRVHSGCHELCNIYQLGFKKLTP